MPGIQVSELKGRKIFMNTKEYIVVKTIIRTTLSFSRIKAGKFFRPNLRLYFLLTAIINKQLTQRDGFIL